MVAEGKHKELVVITQPCHREPSGEAMAPSRNHAPFAALTLARPHKEHSGAIIHELRHTEQKVKGWQRKLAPLCSSDRASR